MTSPPPDHVLHAFGVAGPPTSVEGGQGRSWRSGDAVLKPCEEPEEWTWLGQHLPTVREDGFRLALPLPARTGAWIIDGWCAQTALAGAHPAAPRWLDVITVGERFHRASRHLPRPSFIDDRTDPWAHGDRVAWGEVDPPQGIEAIERLMIVRRPIELASQLVHGDLTENVLFAEGPAPAVIDPTPYWRPPGFASAIVVADAICWHAADPEPLLLAMAQVAEFPQLFVRALLYRIVTSVGFAVGEPDLGAYAGAVELAVSFGA